jgi:hypothetical protein
LKKKIFLAIILASSFIALTACEPSNYKDAKNIQEDYAGGYFVAIKEWKDYRMGYKYKIVYAKDTNVKYMVVHGDYVSGITPLYNADGTLQIYKSDN